MHTTLVDCGCSTKVHGGGVEIYYCPTHAAAPELLEALEELQKGIYDFTELPVYAKNFVYRIASEAIRKAKSQHGTLKGE